ncbi:MAG: sporulation protein [Lachnospiraceae bacterium]|nr:sporulation protein [Lachnospiraceae bacterium]
MASNSDELMKNTIGNLFKGMEGYLSTKSVVGEPIYVGDTIIIPLVNVSFGMGTGSFVGDRKNGGAGGIGGRMTPNAVLVIADGHTRLIDISTNHGINKVLDLVPDFVSNFFTKGKRPETPAVQEARNAARSEMEETIYDASEVE